MSLLSLAFEKIRQKRDLTNVGFAQALCLDPALTSRISNGRRSLSHRLIGQVVVNLSNDEAREVLQAYFTDELQRIREGRLEKAAELGVKLKDPEFSYSVRVIPIGKSS